MATIHRVIRSQTSLTDWAHMETNDRTGWLPWGTLPNMKKNLYLSFSNCSQKFKQRKIYKFILRVHYYPDTKTIQSVSHFSHSVVSDSLRHHESQHARLPCPSPTPGVHSDSRPSSQWCHAAISSTVIPFSSCPQSLPASESFPMSQLFASGGQSTGVSASSSFLPRNTQGWSPLEWTGWISLQSKGPSRVFSNTTVQKHQFFGAQPSSQSNSHIHDHRKNHSLD